MLSLFLRVALIILVRPSPNFAVKLNRIVWCVVAVFVAMIDSGAVNLPL